jgi:glutamate carboxypeptidase
MTEFLKKLVSLESPTGDKAAVDRCSSAVASFLRRAGLNAKRIPCPERGDLFLFEMRTGGIAPAARPLLVLVHSDTVWPVGTLARRPVRISGDRLYGPGALDMKAGLVQACYALAAVLRLGLECRRPIRLLVNSAEETGSPESARLIKSQAVAAEAALCLEPCLSGGALKTRRKGRLVLRLEARGKTAHAGSPLSGVSAIEELAGQLHRAKRLRAGGTTVSFGLVEGGSAANVVADRASAVLDIRFWKAAGKTRVLDALLRPRPILAGAKVLGRVLSETPPLEASTASRRLFSRAKRVASGLGIRLTSGKTGGGSDASIAAARGLPVLDGLGPDGGGIHAEDEHVLLSSLVERTALLTGLLTSL